jgi:hypothetical protein
MGVEVGGLAWVGGERALEGRLHACPYIDRWCHCRP